MGTAYTSAIRTIPDPRTKDFPAWVDDLIDFRLAEAPVARSTTYYVAYDAAGDGTGGSGAGTEADPYLCATVDDIDTLYSSVASGGDVALLLKRGDEWTASSNGIAMDIANTTIGAYGTGNKPRLWAPGQTKTSGWSQISTTDRYANTLTSQPGWIVVESEYTTRVLSRQSAVGDVTSTSNSWFWATNTIQINLGGDDPNSYTIRSFDQGDLIGVNLSADGTRLDGVEASGWGINAASTSNQAHGIKTTVGGTDAAVVTNCESYYGSSHLIAHNYGAGSGGFATFQNCQAGLAQKNSSGETIFNFYTQTGSGEGIFDNCTSTHGTLPEGTSAYVKNAGSAYGHTNTGTNNLTIYRNHTTTDGTWGCVAAVRSDDHPTAAAITDARAFIIGETFNGPGVANGSGGPARTLFSHADEVRINCRFNLTPVGSITIAAFANLPVGGWAINNIYNIDLTSMTTANFGWWNALAATPSDAKFWHCRFDVTGQSTTNARFDFDGTTQSDGVELKNCIVTASGFSGGKTLILNLGNNLVNAGNIDNNAYFGVTGSGDTTTDDGYGNDSNAVELSSSPALTYTPESGDDLYEAGVDLNVEYDFTVTVRSGTSPSIGAYDAGTPKWAEIRSAVRPAVRKAVRGTYI